MGLPGWDQLSKKVLGKSASDIFGDALSGSEGSSAKNYFADQGNIDASQKTLGELLRTAGPDLGLQQSRLATSEVRSNPLLSQLFGQGGAMQRAGEEEKNLASRGYSLQPEDYEAYGQASGNIARMFDTGEQSLAQAMQARGLSSSGVAGKNFMTSQGSKLEQLGQLQSQIAQQRMNTNMQRLGQTRQFLGALGEQAGEQVNNQYNRQMSGRDQSYNMGMGYLSGAQQQANNQFSQMQATRTPGLLENLSGVLAKSPQMAASAAAGALGGPGAAQGVNSQVQGPTGGGRQYSNGYAPLMGPKQQNGSY